MLICLKISILLCWNNTSFRWFAVRDGITNSGWRKRIDIAISTIHSPNRDTKTHGKGKFPAARYLDGSRFNQANLRLLMLVYACLWTQRDNRQTDRHDYEFIKKEESFPRSQQPNLGQVLWYLTVPNVSSPVTLSMANSLCYPATLVSLPPPSSRPLPSCFLMQILGVH